MTSVVNPKTGIVIPDVEWNDSMKQRLKKLSEMNWSRKGSVINPKRKCRGCGVFVNDKSEGCSACYMRHYTRNMRGSKKEVGG